MDLTPKDWKRVFYLLKSFGATHVFKKKYYLPKENIIVAVERFDDLLIVGPSDYLKDIIGVPIEVISYSEVISDEYEIITENGN